jgi:selenocysteine lyase/cysteine desulfurase
MVSDEIQSFRDEIPAVANEGQIHLNNCSAAPIPQRGLDARHECERIWVEAGNPWEQWLGKVNESKRLFAEMINAEEDEIAIVSCATQGFAQITSAFSYDERHEVVTSELEFPTLPQFFRAQEKRGAKLKIAESENGVTVPADAYEKQMSEDTLMVCGAHAYSFTGGLMNVEAVADAVHDYGGYFFLDAYQSTGIVPIDVKEQGIDMLVSGTLKFMLGGPGIAYLYVDRDVANELEPTNLGWFGVEDIFGFETESPTYADGARRFELGTPPAPNAYTAAAGMEFLMEYGIERIRDRIVTHTNALIEGVEDHGFSVRSPHEDSKRGGVVNVQVEDVDAVEQALLDRGFSVSQRAGGVRLSPHFYNTSEEMTQAVDAIAEIATPTTPETSVIE